MLTGVTRTRKMMDESRLQTVLSLFHVKPAQHPGNGGHTAHASPEAHVVTIELAVLL
jgi:hypothetical protein